MNVLLVEDGTMEKYRFSDEELAIIESSCIPYAIYQFVDHRVVTLGLSQGFMDMFGFTDRADTYALMDTNMYRDAHPDDISAISDAALRFATHETGYDVAYRSKIDGVYHVIRAQGKHVTRENGVTIAVVWYSDEGVYDPESGPGQSLASFSTASNLKGSYDHMTGLPGMNYFFEIAEDARKTYKQKGESPVTIFFDFTGMRAYNVQYGFAEGDKLIIGMSQLLIHQFSNENCCRLGGDRFAVFTVETGIEDKLRAVFEEGRKLNNGNSLPIRAGIYPDRMDEVRIGVACDRAKMACDISKGSTESGFNYFSEELLKATEKRQYIIEHLDEAIENQWIQVYYQPIIRAANGCVCDEEALARWIDPKMGFLSPGDFIPILEDEGLIYKLDLYVAEQVLAKMKEFGEAGFFIVPSSVNISRSDFEACDVVEEIRKRVDASGIGRDMITIEITESIVGSDIKYIQRQVERFHELGFKVWMDDYGSGYSSPDILLTIPFDTIKLDMLFIRQFESNPNSRIIINNLVKMALSLGIDTVVEGVETAEQAEFLKEIGCTKLQGYYYTKPIPKTEIYKRYETGTQIGFENPDETEYYSNVGRVNLYDLSMVADNEEGLKDYFNTMPMSIVELDDRDIRITRTNLSYRSFIDKNFAIPIEGEKIRITDVLKSPAGPMMNTLLKCATSGEQMLTDEHASDGRVIHILMRRIALNPITGAKAVLVVVLGVTAAQEAGNLTYAGVAQALSADYIDLYHVNVETENYVEYLPDSMGGMAAERRGEGFFGKAREDALKFLYVDDRQRFAEAFTKEKVIKEIEEKGQFTITYRLTAAGEPFYVTMKGLYIDKAHKKLLFGVNNVDQQMKQREAFEKVKEEHTSFARIAALSGQYLTFFMVDPDTGEYNEYNTTKEFSSLGVSLRGSDFFNESLHEIRKAIHPDDLEGFLEAFTKENILKKIAKYSIFRLPYRLMIAGEPTPVVLKAAIVNEDGKDKMIVGVRIEEK